jgi:arylsulfatase A-like enzyme
LDRRTFFQNSLGAVGAAAVLHDASAGSGAPAEPTAANTQPNVIWFLGDQFRSFAISCNGDPNVHTPNIDILSRTGVNFDHAVTSFPLCSPFRGSMLTGRYPHHCVPGHEYPLPPGQPTIAKPFREAGYRTAYFGKWHVDGWKERNGRAGLHIVPADRRGGFDDWVGYENNNSQWDCWVHGGFGKDAFQYRLPGYETDELTNLLIKYLKERGEEAKAGKGKPFFAIVSVEPPHNPHVAPAEFMSHYNGGQLELRANVPPVERIQEQTRRELAGYYAQIENLDWNLGRVRKTLEETGMQFNTYIFHFADHGDMMGSHGHFLKTTPFEESIRIPMIVSGGVPYYNGNRSGRPSVPFNSVDIAPTTLGLCGIRKPSWMEGTDYSHYRLARRPRESEPDSAYLEQVVPPGFFGPILPMDTLAERVEQADAEIQGGCINLPWRGLVTRDGWKYACLPNTSWLMFNLNEDPYELVNLVHYNSHRSERKKLIDRLKQWVSDTGDTFAVPDN